MSRRVRYWQEMTTTDAGRLSGTDPVAILPLAAVEQHGPHLPLATDCIIGQGLLAAAFERLPKDYPAWVLPMLSVGASMEHGDFPGTLSLEPETLIACVCQCGRAVAAAGVRRLLLSNSHGGNSGVMDLAALRLRRECGLLVVKASYFRFPQPDPPCLDAEELQHGIHGGALEVAMMRHLAPEQVRTDQLGRFESLGQVLARDCRYLGAGRAAAFAWMARDLNPAGVVGNAGQGDAATGERLVAHFGGVLAALIEETRVFPLDALSSPPARGD